MGKMFCLMGKSASGKDTIYHRLLESRELGLKRVVPYTTRPRRTGETDGETYFFCTEEETSRMARAGKIIELRSYDTVHGIWNYFTADDGQICLDTDSYLLIGTLESYQKFRDYFGADRVCPIYLCVEDGLRLERALCRERAQERPRYAEMCRRFLADERDFSGEKLAAAGIRECFENRDVSETVTRIRDYVLKEIQI